MRESIRHFDRVKDFTKVYECCIEDTYLPCSVRPVFSAYVGFQRLPCNTIRAVALSNFVIKNGCLEVTDNTAPFELDQKRFVISVCDKPPCCCRGYRFDNAVDAINTIAAASDCFIATEQLRNICLCPQAVVYGIMDPPKGGTESQGHINTKSGVKYFRRYTQRNNLIQVVDGVSCRTCDILEEDIKHYRAGDNRYCRR